MRLAFWKKKAVPAPSGECAHLWSNWSEPGQCRVVQSFGWSSGSTERDGWAQDRHCLHCNMYERRCA